MSPDARMLHCSSCGAPFANDSRFCRHCGSETTLEERRLDSLCVHCGARAVSGAGFCTQCGRALARQETKLREKDGGCPRCSAALRERALTGITVVECGSCGGLWFSPPVFDQICGDAEMSLRATRELAEGQAPRQPLDTRKVTYLTCPRCKDRMVRRNFGGSSGIIVDVCRHDGIWLDPGELEKVVAFVRSGGLLEARRREVRRLEEEAREAKWKRDFAGGGSSAGSFPSGRAVPLNAASVFDVLCDLLF